MHSNIKERFNNLLPKYAILPIIAALLINNCIYIGAAQLRNHLSFYSLAISLDEKIPLLTPFVIFYVLAYVQWALNYILIGRDSKKLCYQFVLGDILSKVICLFFFILFPTTLTRPEITGTDIFSQLVRFIYSVDAPVNLFPSIHCLESWCCIRAAYKNEFQNRKENQLLSSGNDSYVTGDICINIIYKTACNCRCIWGNCSFRNWNDFSKNSDLMD